MRSSFLILAVALAGFAAWTDWRWRRIPNWLTVSGLVAGLVANAVATGWRGAAMAFEGTGLALLLLLPVVLLRGLGAGDWKLMGALGAILGWKRILLVLLASIFLAALFALAQMLWQKRVRTTLANLWELVRGFFIFGLRPHPEINLDNPEASSIPFGVVVALATAACCWAGRAGF